MLETIYHYLVHLKINSKMKSWLIRFELKYHCHPDLLIENPMVMRCFYFRASCECCLELNGQYSEALCHFSHNVHLQFLIETLFFLFACWFQPQHKHPRTLQ